MLFNQKSGLKPCSAGTARYTPNHYLAGRKKSDWQSKIGGVTFENMIKAIKEDKLAFTRNNNSTYRGLSAIHL
jgi:hypothetical protein